MRIIPTLIASFLLAFVLKEAWEIPISSTLLAVGIIYFMHVVVGQMGSGITTAKKWLENAGKVVMAMVIFLALRFIAWDVLNLSPVETFKMVKGAGGATHMLPNGMPRRVLWEIIFAMFAGGLTIAYVQDKGRTIVKTIFGLSLFILSLQLGFPSYAKTWPNREAVSTNLVRHGVVGTAVIGTWRLAFGPSDQQPTTSTAPVAAKPAEDALVLKSEKVTPCEAFVGYNYKIRTDGHPLRIKFKGCDWIEFPAEGDFSPPATFEAGEARFASPDRLHQNVKVQVYEKVKIQQ